MNSLYVLFLTLVFTCGAYAQEQSTGSVVSIESSIAKLSRPDKYREGSEELRKKGKAALKDLFKAAKDKSSSKAQRVGAMLLFGDIAGRDKTTGEREVSSSEINIFYEKTLSSDPDESMRQTAAICMANTGDKSNIPKLRKGLEDKSSKVKARAAWALAKLGDMSGKEAALNALEDKDAGAQIVAVEAIEAIGDKTLIPNLQGMMKSKDVGVRLNAKLALKRLEAKNLSGESKIAYFSDVLKDDEPEAAQWAVKKLVEEINTNGTSRASAVKALKECADDKSGRNSYFAAKWLNQLYSQGKVSEAEIK